MEDILCMKDYYLSIYVTLFTYYLLHSSLLMYISRKVAISLINKPRVYTVTLPEPYIIFSASFFCFMAFSSS
jgi:hypothetical protein